MHLLELAPPVVLAKEVVLWGVPKFLKCRLAILQVWGPSDVARSGFFFGLFG